MKISTRSSLNSTRRKGFTLVELLVASALFAIMAISLLVVFRAGLDSWRRTQTHLEVYQSARAGFDMMTRELSAAYLNSSNATITFRGFPGTSPSGWVSPSGGDEIFFVAALNPSLNYSDAAFELCKVGYYLDNVNNVLMKYFYYVKTGTTPDFNFSHNTAAYNVTFSKIASNVTGLTFQYYDATGAVSNTWDSTIISPTLNQKPAEVRITLTVKEPNSTRTQTFTNGVCIPQ